MSLSICSQSPALASLPPAHRKLFCQFSQGVATTPSHPTITAAIDYSISHHPNLIAAHTLLADGSLHPTDHISYATLGRRSENVAAALQAHGVTPGESVCLFLSRGIDMIVSIVAILRIGANYVPQDARIAPHDQLTRVASATKARIVLTSDAHIQNLPTFTQAQVLTVRSAEQQARHLPPFKNPKLPVQPSATCYIIFTSGTTGLPKGVQVTHGNVANVLLTDPMSLNMRPGVRVSQILSIAFDMCAWEVLGSLSHASTLIIRHRNISHAVQQAQVVISTPSVLGTIDSSRMHHVKTVAVAGEPCPRALADEWSQFCTFYNSCGPTEVTIINTAKKCSVSDARFTIGKPTPNNTVYVLDPRTRQPCKIGQVGEMWAGGDCVSKGYLDNEQLTRERFVHDPFVGGPARMYRTGDLGRWTTDGELEHFGRVDEQVKVKGFRVELDGVSSIIESNPQVKKAVVLKVNDALVAFVTPSHIIPQQVMHTVKDRLPYYCVPSQILCMDKFPRTGNGKVDKRALLRGLAHSHPAVPAKIEKGTKNLMGTADLMNNPRSTWIVQAIVQNFFVISKLVRNLLALARDIA
ncbi:Nonribosomal peptide synthetase 5 [Gracilariopsis chorda]|uniref:Nonribosomal peptide synthetase 5 n=1 Tax=Gracilariopsis chorda TaxID=448386 RepID=A0A2V3IRR1_9FLOR|nr:Nonribosomal peptide synthetase 5 [Gracilariopsis chorda]|eukprot:PXF44794.1 Nonribosomal peptide synthetase 5 [Gracilariopsis chorda]